MVFFFYFIKSDLNSHARPGHADERLYFKTAHVFCAYCKLQDYVPAPYLVKRPTHHFLQSKVLTSVSSTALQPNDKLSRLLLVCLQQSPECCFFFNSGNYCCKMIMYQGVLRNSVLRRRQIPLKAKQCNFRCFYAVIPLNREYFLGNSST